MALTRVLCAVNGYLASVWNIIYAPKLETVFCWSQCIAVNETQWKQWQFIDTDFLWNHECFHEIGFRISVSFWMFLFKSHSMSVLVCIKGCKNRRKRLKVKGICKMNLSIWHFGKTESRYLVTSEAVSWSKWIWHMLTQGTKYSYEVHHALPFNKMPPHIRDLSSD